MRLMQRQKLPEQVSEMGRPDWLMGQSSADDSALEDGRGSESTGKTGMLNTDE